MKVELLIRELQNFERDAEVVIEKGELFINTEIKALGCKPKMTKWILMKEEK